MVALRLTARLALMAAFFSWYVALASLNRPNSCLPWMESSVSGACWLAHASCVVQREM